MAAAPGSSDTLEFFSPLSRSAGHRRRCGSRYLSLPDKCLRNWPVGSDFYSDPVNIVSRRVILHCRSGTNKRACVGRRRGTDLFTQSERVIVRFFSHVYTRARVCV